VLTAQHRNHQQNSPDCDRNRDHFPASEYVARLLQQRKAGCQWARQSGSLDLSGNRGTFGHPLAEQEGDLGLLEIPLQNF
jgi:hypothetical protein